MKTAPLFLDYRRSRPPSRALSGTVMLIFGIVALAALSVHGVRLALDLRDARVQLEEMQSMTQRRGAMLRAGARDGGEIGRDTARANAVLRQLNLPWSQLFDAVESSKGDSIALLSIAPDAQQRLLKVSGEASVLDDVLAYLKRLTAVQMFESVYLLDHEFSAKDGQKSVRFTIAATWRDVK
jgi:Tfp pilus assembly protein PilN